MVFSRSRLHGSVFQTPEHKAAVEAGFASLLTGLSPREIMGAAPVGAVTVAASVQIPLTTVSLNSNFDAYINVSFNGTKVPLLLDSGNSVLIMPRFEDIQAIPNWQQNYQVLGSSPEPWGCPANIVRGPISIETVGGGSYLLKDCVFYACTGDPANGGERTANFGAGCLSPWAASGWNTLPALNITLQSPLSYNPDYPFVEFDYAAAADIHGLANTPKVAIGSYLTLSQTLPAGYALFNLLPNLMWMAVTPKSLTIGGTPTQWPGAVNPLPIAMIDTGGGPAFLSDPNGLIYNNPWPGTVPNPGWTSTSTDCRSTSDDVGIALGDATSSYAYAIKESILPLSAQGLTLVMCRTNCYMMGENGMNIGGISALSNSILIDYQGCRVGFKPKI